jgi:3-hydroxybutyryl-CoA dehydrogenase
VNIPVIRVSKTDMQLAILANEGQKEELSAGLKAEAVSTSWLNHKEEFAAVKDVDARIDLLFDGSRENIELLKKNHSGLVVVNSVIKPLGQMDEDLVRINGWPGFLGRTIIEACYKNGRSKEQAEEIFALFGKKMEWVADEPGFISPRVIAMIVNEAYFALSEAVTTKEEIDIAMKLGTNYPFGPFEWCEKIGKKNISELLVELAKTNERYQPCALLKQEASQ